MSDGRAAALRSALSAHDPDRIEASNLQDSAVLIAVCEHEEPVVPLVLRSAYRSEHAGEVGLPGGRTEDGEDLERTALREANEEIGLTPDSIEVVGRLSDASTPTGYRIEPYVGYVPGAPGFERDETEVDSVYVVGVAALAAGRSLDPPRFDCTARTVQGPATPSVSVRGTTAGILEEFFEVAGDAL